MQTASPGAHQFEPPSGPTAPPAPGFDDGLSAHAAARCPECGEELLGAYCHRCGESAPDPGRVTTRRYLRSLAHELLDVDSKTLRTLVDLVRRPGLLTAEYLAGHTRRYLSPVRLFLIAWG